MTVFKTLAEVRNYIKKNPIGKSWVRLDDGSGFEVRSKGEETHKPLDGNNKFLSKQDLRKLVGVEFLYKAKYELKESSFENKYRKVVKDFKSADRRRKNDLKISINRSDSKTKKRGASQPRHKDNHKRYINETWGGRSD